MANPPKKDEPREQPNSESFDGLIDDLVIADVLERIDEGKMSVGEGAQFFDHSEDQDKP